MPVINVTDRKGARHVLEGVEGWRVMEILRDYGVGLDGVCGGSCDCATCHVVVANDWVERIHPPRGDEVDKLDELPILEPTSRLSCQIIFTDALDGLTLTIAEAA